MHGANGYIFRKILQVCLREKTRGNSRGNPGQNMRGNSKRTQLPKRRVQNYTQRRQTLKHTS